jgi:4-hydroxy-tetrahydrodipicolinate reductase
VIKVGISGAGGRMGRTVALAVTQADDLELTALFDPGCAGEVVEGLACQDSNESLSGCDVVVEFTRPDVVMDNLGHWNNMGLNAVVGTSGFDEGRLAGLEEIWQGTSRCLVVPNFSIGAILMMRFAEEAAEFYEAVEIIEMHHDNKIDAPSGTSIATADRLAGKSPQRRSQQSEELQPGALGATVSGARIHSVRLPGLLAHQEVLFGNPGEILTIRHDSTSRDSFTPGILLGIRKVQELGDRVTVGLDSLI